MQQSHRLTLDPSDQNPRWIQIAYEGEWSGHHQGSFQFTRKDFDTIVRNFRASPQYDGKSPVVAFDFNHASEQDPTSGSIPREGTPAAAWALDLQVRGNGLWALTDVLEPARSQIKARQLRWVSSAVWFDGRDPVSGKSIGPVLTSVAFTNQPFLKGLQPLAASAAQPPKKESPIMNQQPVLASVKAAFIMSKVRELQAQGHDHASAHALASDMAREKYPVTARVVPSHAKPQAEHAALASLGPARAINRPRATVILGLTKVLTAAGVPFNQAHALASLATHGMGDGVEKAPLPGKKPFTDADACEAWVRGVLGSASEDQIRLTVDAIMNGTVPSVLVGALVRGMKVGDVKGTGNTVVAR